MSVISYLGVPIRGPSGHALGSFCAIDGRPYEWTDGEEKTLFDISQMLESEIKLRHEIQEKALLLQEMSHRIGNTFAVIN